MEYFMEDIKKKITQEDLWSLYEASEILNRVHDINILLDKIMDIAIKSSSAERGFLMLKREEGIDCSVSKIIQTDDKIYELCVVVARNMDKKVSDSEDISMTAIEEVLKNKKPVLSSNAQSDPRFDKSASVVRYNLRSILAIPLFYRGDNNSDNIKGILYMDSKVQNGIFEEKTIYLMQAFVNLASLSVENVGLQYKLKKENEVLKEELHKKYNFTAIVGKSESLKRVLSIVERVIESDVPVLLEGESGTGKELIARAIHYNGHRRNSRFVAQYCGAMPETLLESELFGYKRGAFTGADKDKPGLFEIANGGTFFLDEIGDVSLNIQAKLLRVLQEKVIRRLGDDKEIPVDVRIISATNKSLERMVKEGTFREDLYYRLKVVGIKIPPLKERKEDIPLLVDFILKKLGINKTFAPEAMELLLAYSWPGNIRELENVINYAIVMSKENIIKPEDLPPEMFSGEKTVMSGSYTLEDVERMHILKVLKDKNGNRKETAKALGISLRALQYRLKEYREKGYNV